MGNDKIYAILHRHKDKARTLIIDTLKEGCNAWSQQAAELQLWWFDRDNRATQATTNLLGVATISFVHQAIAMDITYLAGRQQEMLTQLWNNLAQDQQAIEVQLQQYEGEWKRTTESS